MEEKEIGIFRAFFSRLWPWYLAAVSAGIAAGHVGFNVRSDSNAPFAMNKMTEYADGMGHLFSSWEHIQILLYATLLFAVIKSTVMHANNLFVIQPLLRRSAIGRPQFSRTVRYHRAHFIAGYLFVNLVDRLMLGYIGWVVYTAFKPFDRTHMVEFLEVVERPFVILSTAENYPGLWVYLAGYVAFGTAEAIFIRPHRTRAKKRNEARVAKEDSYKIVARAPQEYYKPARRSFLGKAPERLAGYQYELFVDTLPPRKWWQIRAT